MPLFTLAGISPIFVTTNDLFTDPVAVVGKIASAMPLQVAFGGG